MPEVVIVDAVRTPIGALGGALSKVRPDDMGGLVLKALIDRTGIDPAIIEEVYMGCANQAGEDNRNVARMAALLAGFPVEVPAVTYNRLCASGLHSVVQAYRALKVGDGDVYVAFRGGEPVGYLRLEWLWSKLPYIEFILVLEPHRRAGIGQALLAHVEAEAASQGHTALYSSSQADEPEPQAWHRRSGFEECGLLAGLNEGGIGEVFFRKSLAPAYGTI